MKISKTQLKEMIREELNEGWDDPTRKKELLKHLLVYEKMLGKAIKEVKSSIKGKENLDSWLELLSQVSFGIGTLADKVAQEPMKFE
jgi:hypothetical protein